jgi:hypothetical protein
MMLKSATPLKLNSITNARNKKIKVTAGFIAKKIRQQKPPEHSKP